MLFKNKFFVCTYEYLLIPKMHINNLLEFLSPVTGRCFPVYILVGCDENVPKFSFHGHLSFFNWKSRSKCSAPLKSVSYRHWPGRSRVCCGYSKCKWNIMAHLFVYFEIVKVVVESIKTRLEEFVPQLTKARWFSLPPFQLVSKLPIKKQGGALKL